MGRYHSWGWRRWGRSQFNQSPHKQIIYLFHLLSATTKSQCNQHLKENSQWKQWGSPSGKVLSSDSCSLAAWALGVTKCKVAASDGAEISWASLGATAVACVEGGSFCLLLVCLLVGVSASRCSRHNFLVTIVLLNASIISLNVVGTYYELSLLLVQTWQHPKVNQLSEPFQTSLHVFSSSCHTILPFFFWGAISS